MGQAGDAGLYVRSDPPGSVYDQCNCFLDLLDDSLNNEIGETPYIIAANHLTEVSGLEVKRLGTKDKAADDADGQTGTCLTVWPSKKGRRAKPFASRELRHWIKQELIAVPGFTCSQCGSNYFDGVIACQSCSGSH